MVALLALASIAGGIVTTVLTYPVAGLWSLLLAPLGGSLVTAIVGLAVARQGRVTEVSVDDMVNDLRSVLPTEVQPSDEHKPYPRRGAA